jgi:hypothetical protein
VRALERLQAVRSIGIAIPPAASIPPSRIASLARFADKAKVSAVMRLPEKRRLATLVAFIHTPGSLGSRRCPRIVRDAPD